MGVGEGRGVGGWWGRGGVTSVKHGSSNVATVGAARKTTAVIGWLLNVPETC